MPKLNLPFMPPGLTPVGQLEFQHYQERLQVYRELILKHPMSILVCGPYKERTGAIADKRHQIVDALKELHYTPLYSEDLSDKDDELSLYAQEVTHAWSAHLIILLIEDAQGALAELHDWYGREEMRHKLYALVPVKYRDGYSGLGVLRFLVEAYNAVYWYQDGELQDCNVLTAALTRCRQRREMEALKQLKGVIP